MVMLQLKKRSGAATGFLAIVAAAAVLTPRGFFGAHALSDTDYWKLINGSDDHPDGGSSVRALAFGNSSGGGSSSSDSSDSKGGSSSSDSKDSKYGSSSSDSKDSKYGSSSSDSSDSNSGSSSSDSGDGCWGGSSSACDDTTDDDGSTHVPDSDYVCYDAFGIPGIQSSNGVACCLASCGACGGSGCSLLEGGGDGCCTDNIIEINELCESKGEAPCLIIPQRDDPIVSDDDTHSSSGDVCPDAYGIPGFQSSDGVACCLSSCGACGGTGCSSLEGGGDGCCTTDIIENHELCESKGEAPCLIVPQVDTPDVPPSDDDNSTGYDDDGGYSGSSSSDSKSGSSSSDSKSGSSSSDSKSGSSSSDSKDSKYGSSSSDSKSGSSDSKSGSSSSDSKDSKYGSSSSDSGDGGKGHRRSRYLRKSIE